MRISIAKIKQTVPMRPAGYVEAVLGAGTIEGDWLVITPEAYASLCKNYSPTKTLAQAGTCIEAAKPAPAPSPYYSAAPLAPCKTCGKKSAAKPD